MRIQMMRLIHLIVVLTHRALTDYEKPVYWPYPCFKFHGDYTHPNLRAADLPCQVLMETKKKWNLEEMDEKKKAKEEQEKLWIQVRDRLRGEKERARKEEEPGARPDRESRSSSGGDGGSGRGGGDDADSGKIVVVNRDEIQAEVSRLQAEQAYGLRPTETCLLLETCDDLREAEVAANWRQTELIKSVETQLQKKLQTSGKPPTEKDINRIIGLKGRYGKG